MTCTAGPLRIVSTSRSHTALICSRYRSGGRGKQQYDNYNGETPLIDQLLAPATAEREGRGQTSGLSAAIARRPLAVAVGMTAAFIALGVIIGAVSRAVLPPIAQLPDFIALVGLTVALAGLLTVLGWWRAVGFNRPAQWRDLHLLWLPAAVVIVLPALKGFALPSTGTLAFWIAGYVLTGLYEETLMRGVMPRVLRSRGPVQVVFISAALFGLLHVSNIVLRNPVIVLAQMVGAACEGVGLAALRLRTNTIWLVIAVHAAEDVLLHVGRLPVIPVNVVQSIIMLGYGLYLLRGLRRHPAAAAAQAT